MLVAHGVPVALLVGLFGVVGSAGFVGWIRNPIPLALPPGITTGFAWYAGFLLRRGLSRSDRTYSTVLVAIAVPMDIAGFLWWLRFWLV